MLAEAAFPRVHDMAPSLVMKFDGGGSVVGILPMVLFGEVGDGSMSPLVQESYVPPGVALLCAQGWVSPLLRWLLVVLVGVFVFFWARHGFWLVWVDERDFYVSFHGMFGALAAAMLAAPLAAMRRSMPACSRICPPEEDAERLRLTDRLLQAVLAEARVVCVGQPMLIAGDLNADPAVIPCLAKGISAGRYVDLALAHSLGAGLTPGITCTFNRDDGTGSRRDFFVGCPGALAASQSCCVTDRWFTPHFSVLARFRNGAWMADVACPVTCQPLWPACWLDTPDRSSSSSSRVVQDVWDIYRDAASRSAVDDFWSIWSRNAKAG